MSRLYYLEKCEASGLTQHCRVSAMPHGISLVPPAECLAPNKLSLYTEEMRHMKELKIYIDIFSISRLLLGPQS